MFADSCECLVIFMIVISVVKTLSHDFADCCEFVDSFMIVLTEVKTWSHS